MRFKVGDRIVLRKEKSLYNRNFYGYVIEARHPAYYKIQWNDGVIGSGTCDSCELHEEPNDIMKNIL